MSATSCPGNVDTTPTERRHPIARAIAAITASSILGACAPAPLAPAGHHLGSHTLAGRPEASVPTPGDAIPPTVGGTSMPPRPRSGPKLETYSVVVSQVEISELLFAMARDAKINVDVHPAVKGKVTLNAVNQTLPQILARLSKQVDLRYEFDGKNLVVLPDAPFVRHYSVDYVNMTRESRSTTSIATQIASTGRDPVGGSGGGGSSQTSNNSTSTITNVTNNRFWETMTANLRQLLIETAPAAERGASSEGSGRTQGGSGSGSGRSGGSGGTTASGGGGSGGVGGAIASAITGALGQGGGSGGSGGGAQQSSGGAGPSSSGPSSGGGQGSSGGGANDGHNPVIVNAETGVLTIFATQRQHERVRQYLDKIMNSARRQVMIEATIVEVQLSDEFQQGVNWSRLRADGSGWAYQQQPQGTGTLPSGALPNSGPSGIQFPATVNAAGAAGTLPGNALVSQSQTNSLGVLRYLNSTSSWGNIGAAVSLLQSFGKVKVLSSPKISVLNNQTAVLKVVDNRVYFTINVNVTPGSATTAALVTYTSTPNTVPVGFVMSVTPQIEESGNVTMNVRPTISRIIGYVNDPNPQLAQNNVTSRIPEIQTREMESILKVGSGDVAVMGGLMQDSVSEQQDGVPGASGVPVLGNLFKYRNDSTRKSELVIFMRPIVVRDASIEGDYRGMKDMLPGSDFFTKPTPPSVPRAWMREPDAPAAADASGARAR